MRYEKGRKDASRRRIMAAAAQRFRKDGIAASGLADIMSDAGLTNGAFYPHFPSKAALVRESVGAALEDQSNRLHGILAADGLEGLIEAYLSPEHRDDPGKGCAAAALLPELARQPLQTRRLCAERLLSVVRDMVRALPSQTQDREDVALGLYAILIGTLQLARTVKGTPASDHVLAAGAKAARTLLRRQVRHPDRSRPPRLRSG